MHRHTAWAYIALFQVDHNSNDVKKKENER